MASKVFYSLWHRCERSDSENVIFFSSGSKRKSKGMATEQDVYEAGGQKCHQQNLNISFVFACLMPELSPQNIPFADKIVQFLNGTESFKILQKPSNEKKRFDFLFSDNLLSIDTSHTEVSVALIKLLRTILIENGVAWNRSLSTSVVDLLTLIISYDDKGKFSRDIASKVFNLLCGIVTRQVACYPWVLAPTQIPFELLIPRPLFPTGKIHSRCGYRNYRRCCVKHSYRWTHWKHLNCWQKWTMRFSWRIYGQTSNRFARIYRWFE